MGEEEEDVLGPRNNQNKGRGTLEEAVIFPPPPYFTVTKCPEVARVFTLNTDVQRKCSFYSLELL